MGPSSAFADAGATGATGATGGTAIVDSSILSPPVRIGDGLHTPHGGGFAFLSPLESVKVTSVDPHHAHPPMALESVVVILAICALAQTGRVAVGHFLELIQRLRFA